MPLTDAPATLTVLDPGFSCVLVDAGRPGLRALGVSPGGPADRMAFTLGNLLVGNPPNAAALEIALAGPTLRASASLACVLSGAPFQVRTNRRSLAANVTFTLEPEETLHVAIPGQGVRAYLCVGGGLHPPGGQRHAGPQPLRAGDSLACRAARIHGRRLPQPPDDPRCRHLAGAAGPVPLRVLDGPQAAWFPPGVMLADGPGRCVWTVTPDSNRMGLRLDGPPLPAPGREMISEPVCAGAVQVTRDGRAILLGVDCQTIGGYPKPAQVIAADLDLVGQLRPGDRVAFHRVGLAEAATLYRRRQTWLARTAARLAEAELFAFGHAQDPR